MRGATCRARRANEDKVISLPRRPPEREKVEPEIETRTEERIKTVAPAGSTLNEGLRAVATADRSFDPETFLAGARAAYEMIVTAFAEGDRKALKQLLSREVYDGFVSAITEREARQEKIEFKFVGIDKAEITAASLKNGTAQITVRFLSKLISATHDKSGDRDRRRSDPCRRRDRHLDLRARGQLARSELEAGRHRIGRLTGLRAGAGADGERRLGSAGTARAHRVRPARRLARG